MKIGKAGVSARGANNRTIVLVAAGLMIGLGLLIGATARADDAVGSVTEISGDAQIERGGAKLPVDEGMVVKVHDQVTTQPGASLTLGFGDGSSIALSANTSIAIDASTTMNGQTLPSRMTLIRGDIHTIVPDRTTGRQHSIEVDTPNTKETGTSPNSRQSARRRYASDRVGTSIV
jgi:hypothetical protein